MALRTALPLEPLRALLEPSERERAERLRPPGATERSVIATAAVRIVVAAAAGLDAADMRLVRRCAHCGEVGHGKPALEPNPLGIEFNLSHSGSLALVAVALERAVGVDIEAVREKVDVEAIANRFLAPAERDCILSQPGTARREAFFACWARKEAYLKGLGVGLAGGLDGFAVDPLAAGAQTVRHGSNVPWTIRGLSPGNGYKAAIAAEGEGWKVTTRMLELDQRLDEG